MKTYEAIIIFAIILIIFIIGFGLSMLDDVVKNIKQSPYIEAMGKMVVIDKDTLSVVNYNTWKNELYLSNGTKIDFDYYKKTITKDE